MTAASGKLPGFVIFMAAVPLLLAGAVTSGSDGGESVDAFTTKTAEKTFASEQPGLVTSGFMANLPSNLQQSADGVGDKLLLEFGAVFVARGVIHPDAVVFRDAESVAAFQMRAGSAKAVIGGVTVELQPAALEALLAAESNAHQKGLTITPRGTLAARRSYDETASLWTKRVEPGLDHWRARGRISDTDALRIKELSSYEQVAEVLRLEDRGLYFAKDFAKSIIYSGAPPGSSQHLSMLALDVVESDNPAVRDILAKHGWFQTVVSDLPHFTYLGAPEADLTELGLKKVTGSGRSFWVPNMQ